MKKTILNVLLLAGVFSFSLTSSWSRAEEESDLKAPVKTDYRSVDKLNGQLNDVSVGNEMDEADAVGNAGVENEAKQEAAALKRDINRLEQQVKVLKAGAEQSRKNAELAQKKTDLVRAQNNESKKHVAAAVKLKNKADQDLEFDRRKLAVAEAELASNNEEVRKLNIFIQTDAAEREKAIERAKVVKAQIAQSKQQQQALAAKHKKLNQDNKDYNERITKAEARANLPAASTREPSSTSH